MCIFGLHQRNPSMEGIRVKAGRTITELAKEIERQQNSKVDLIASTRNMGISVDEDCAIGLALPEGKSFSNINDVGHSQIADYTKIPKPYYDRMRREAPYLLSTNV